MVVDKNPHGPNSYTNYFDVHARRMQDFVTSGFVLVDGIVTVPVGGGLLSMEGTVECLGQIDVQVFKLLEVQEQEGRDRLVQTVEYHYNAKLRGRGNILRYDCPHYDHRPYDHVHRFDVFNDDEEGTVEECEWPTLGDVLGELEAWYWQHEERLRTTAPDAQKQR